MIKSLKLDKSEKKSCQKNFKIKNFKQELLQHQVVEAKVIQKLLLPHPCFEQAANLVDKILRKSTRTFLHWINGNS